MNEEIMAEIDAFLLEIEMEATKLGIIEELNDVMIILGYSYPKEHKNIFEAIKSGWKTKTTDIADLGKIYNTVYAVISTIVKLKLDAEAISILRSEGKLLDLLIELLITEYTGKWLRQGNIPKGWIGLDDCGIKFTRSHKKFVLIDIKEVLAVPMPIKKIVKDVLDS